MARILIYCAKLWSSGGIESHILKFCEKMSSENVEIDILVPEFSFKGKETEVLKSFCNRIIVFRSKNRYLSKLWLAYQIFRLSKIKYDALYTNGQGESFFMIGNFIQYNKWVHHHHQSGDEEDQATWGRLYKKALTSSTNLIACSHRNAGLMEKALERKVNVITCFSRSISLNKPGQSPRAKIRFGYFGRLIPEKGIDFLCQLSNDPEIKQAEFHIWGEGDAYPSSYFKNYPNVKYHGPFDGNEGLKTALHSIDAFLLLSTHREGLPISLLEVMSAGIPWLASDRGGIRDIACDPMSTRVIDYPLDYDKVKVSVIALLNDLLAGKVSKTAQIQLYTSRFSSEALAKQWKEVLFAN